MIYDASGPMPVVSPSQYVSSRGELPDIIYFPCSYVDEDLSYIKVIKCPCHEGFEMLHVVVRKGLDPNFYQDQESLTYANY